MKYKRIKSAAHNFAHSFASDLHWVTNDYAMSYLARAAVQSGTATLNINLVSGDAQPDVLLTTSLRESIAHRVSWFPTFMRNEGIDHAALRTAELKLTFDLSSVRTRSDLAGALEVPFAAVLAIEDDRGVNHVGEYRDYWVADPFEPAPPPPRRWWHRLTRPAA